MSDADRTQAADRLSKHYSDGRLDETEFNARLDRAMNASTWSDLTGLFDDLPEPAAAETPRPPARRAHPHTLRRAVGLVLVLIVTVAVAHSLLHSLVFWLLIGFLAFMVLRHGPGRQRRY